MHIEKGKKAKRQLQMETTSTLLNESRLISSGPRSTMGCLSNSSVDAMILEYRHILNRIHPNHPVRKKIVTFPVKLYLILKLAPKYDLDHIISWQVHGRNFVIRDRNLFLQEIANRVFESTKFASLQRQLNVYDFKIVPSKHKIDKGAYYHPQFLRGRFDLCQTIVRVRVGGDRRLSLSSTSSSQASTFTAMVPNFYALPYCDDDNEDSSLQITDPAPNHETCTNMPISTCQDGPLIYASDPTSDLYVNEFTKVYGSQQDIQLMDAQPPLHHPHGDKSEPLRFQKSRPTLQHATQNMFSKLDNGQRDQLVKDMTILDELLQQNVQLLRSRAHRSPVTMAESHGGIRTTQKRNMQSPQFDWNHVGSEGTPNICNAEEDVKLSSSLLPTPTSKSREEKSQLPFYRSSTMTLEQVLGEYDDLHGKKKEAAVVVDDFHGRTFHFVDNDAVDKPGGCTCPWDECR